MGWSVILSKIKDFRYNGGDIKLMKMQPNVFEVYRLLEFDLFLDAYDNIDDTILSLNDGNIFARVAINSITNPSPYMIQQIQVFVTSFEAWFKEHVHDFRRNPMTFLKKVDFKK